MQTWVDLTWSFFSIGVWRTRTSKWRKYLFSREKNTFPGLSSRTIKQPWSKRLWKLQSHPGNSVEWDDNEQYAARWEHRKGIKSSRPWSIDEVYKKEYSQPLLHVDRKDGLQSAVWEGFTLKTSAHVLFLFPRSWNQVFDSESKSFQALLLPLSHLNFPFFWNTLYHRAL